MIQLGLKKLLKIHPCLVYHQDISAICEPLKLLGIDYFAHVMLHNNGMVSGVSSNPEYLKHYMTNQLFNLDLHTEVGMDKFEYLHWDFMPHFKKYNSYHQGHLEFGMYNIFSRIKSDNDAIHLYHFATSKFDSMMNTFYVSNLEALDKFILFYHEKFQQNKSLTISHQLTFPVKKNIMNSNLIKYDKLMLLNNNKIEFFNLLDQKTSHSAPTIKLSPREKECLKLLARGHTAKSIGKELDLSPKTVYFYLDNTKKKLCCHGKLDLIQYYWNYLDH